MSEINQFSKRHQEAVLGHVFKDSELWAQIDALGVTKDWFETATAKEVYDLLSSFRTTYKRAPNQTEFESFLETTDASSAFSRKSFVERAIQTAESIGIDIIRTKLVDWAKSRIVAQRGVELAQLYNKGEHATAFKLWEQGAIEIQRIEASAGAVPDRMESAADRVSREQEQRYSDGDNTLEYGIPFLDAVLINIIPNDLIMIGATTGAGKTELAKIVARHNARKGKKIAFFALEAEENEIERRIKFSMLIEYWKEDNPGIKASDMFGYAEWRLGKYKNSLDKYTTAVEERFRQDYSTLKTYYRVRGDFSVEDLDREIMKVHQDSDLIILDHLHYVDLDGKDENQEMKRLVKRLRHLALGLGVPILCIAHLKKGAGKSLVPELDDFMGSSDITKIATTCIMLARCEGFATAETMEQTGSPTFMRIAKFRLDGDRVGWVGIGFYNKTLGGYTERYALGRLNFAGSKWVPFKGSRPFWVDDNKILTEVSEVD